MFEEKIVERDRFFRAALLVIIVLIIIQTGMELSKVFEFEVKKQSTITVDPDSKVTTPVPTYMRKVRMDILKRKIKEGKLSNRDALFYIETF
ncbi:MAG: hypothetical protein KAQ98_01150 [Bacteriovoracaceae bacterium]|nr:hypothetical protein [Bacteriovoracaceae bacterium]